MNSKKKRMITSSAKIISAVNLKLKKYTWVPEQIYTDCINTKATIFKMIQKKCGKKKPHNPKKNKEEKNQREQKNQGWSSLKSPRKGKIHRCKSHLIANVDKNQSKITVNSGNTLIKTQERSSDCSVGRSL